MRHWDLIDGKVCYQINVSECDSHQVTDIFWSCD